MNQIHQETITGGTSVNIFEKILSVLVVGLALVAILLLSARQFTSTDLGYHLAFGEVLFKSGTIVDYTPFIYTLPESDVPRSDRPEPGPGNWYDRKGRYLFPNTNWLSQFFIYASWRLAGANGLNLLQIFLVMGLFSLLIILMKRSRLPCFLIALALLLMGLIINSRLDMRPELFGYFCLVVQYSMLLRLSNEVEKPMPPSWLWTGSMVVAQLLFVNFHSYFLLGLAISGAVFTQYFFQALKKRLIDKNILQFRAYKKLVYRLGMTLIGMLLVCFINPWGWRLALLPFQTLLYMKEHNIGGQYTENNPHPWASIFEFKPTISENWLTRISDYGVMGILALATLAIIFQTGLLLLRFYQTKHSQVRITSHLNAFCVKWAHLFMIGGMLLVGLQMRRNIGVASLIIVPSALICIVEGLQYFQKENMKRVRLRLFVIVNSVVILCSVYGGYLIISGKIFETELDTRFGFGISNTMLPIGTSFWLNEHAPDAQVWCDFPSSSTLRFFTRPHIDLPILTNTWAYPPRVLAEDLFYRKARIPFSSLANKYNIDAVVLRSDFSLPLHRHLGADPRWKMVYVEGVHVLYMRANNKHRSLTEKYEITPANFNADSFVVQELGKDPSFKRAILNVAISFETAGELDLAIKVIEAGLNYQPQSVMGWRKLLNLYGLRGEEQHIKFGDKQFIPEFKRMKYILEKIIELDPHDSAAVKKLERANKLIKNLLSSNPQE